MTFESPLLPHPPAHIIHNSLTLLYTHTSRRRSCYRVLPFFSGGDTTNKKKEREKEENIRSCLLFIDSVMVTTVVGLVGFPTLQQNIIRSFTNNVLLFVNCCDAGQVVASSYRIKITAILITIKRIQ